MATACTQICAAKSSNDINISIIKKLLKGRNRSGDQYKCGSCRSTFETICNLHAHCLKHATGGSYHFDNFTGTAYPKYDTTCSSTQYELKDIGTTVTELIDDQVDSGCTTTVRDLIDKQLDTECIKHAKRKVVQQENIHVKRLRSRRVSRIAELQESYKSLENSDETRKKTDNDVEINGSTLKIDGTETFNIEEENHAVISNNDDNADSFSEDSVSKAGQTKGTNVKTLTKKALRKKRSENANSDTDKEDTNNMLQNVQDGKSEAVSITKAGSTISNMDTFGDKQVITSKEKCVGENCNEQKKDELTATEALLEIGKRDSSLSKSGGYKKVSMKNLRKGRKKVDLKDKAEETQKSHDTDVVSRVQKGQANPRVEEIGSGHSLRRTCVCGVCGKIGSPSMVTYHKYLHGDKMLECNVCGAQFQNPSTLKSHMRQHGSKQYKCDQCQAEFHRKQYLVTHMLTHTGERPFMCETCGMAYRDANNLNRHVRHTHENVRNFECDICHEKFYRIDHMKNHRARHFDANMKCLYCSKNFKLLADLKRHTKIHTGDKPYKCQICQYGFVTILPYYTHMLKKHNIDRDEAKERHNKWKSQVRDTSDDNKVPSKKLSKKNSDVNTGSSKKLCGDISCLKTKKKDKSKRQWKEKVKQSHVENMIYCSDLVLGSDLDESDNDVSDLENPLYLQGQEVEIGTSALTTGMEHNNQNRLNGKYSNLCTSIDLDHSSYSENIGSVDSRFPSLLGEKPFKSFESLSPRTGEQQETAVSVHMSQFPVQGVFSDPGVDGTDSVGLLGYAEGDHSVEQLKEGQIVVLGEEGSDLGILSQLDGDNVHAVIVGDYEYGNEVIVD